MRGDDVNGNLLADRAVGCLAGAAVGDALGGATEGWESHEIHAHYGGWVTGVVESIRRARGIERPFSPFHKGDGHVTDDTLMTRVLVRAYATKRDHLEAHDVERLVLPAIVDEKTWIPELGRDELLYHRLFLAEKWLVLKLRYGHADPREAGVGNIVNCGAAMYVAPVGIANAGAPDAAYREALDLTGAHQASYGREAAGVLAACVAEALRPDATVETVVATALRLAKDGTRPAIEAVTATAAGLDGWRPDGLADLRAAFAPFDSVGDVYAAPAQNARIPATTWRRCSAASTTGATPTRSRRWAARLPAPSAASARFRASGSTRSRPRAGSTWRRQGARWPSWRRRSSPRTRGGTRSGLARWPS
jgi:ADP-ribosylglycohydrolase